MPRFSSDPPKDPRGRSLTLLRCPPFKPMVAIVTSLDLVGCPTHFYGGKTMPCEETKCKPCLEGIPWSWHSYVAAYDHVAKLHFLFESTARASEPFKQYRDANGTIRGCLFKAQRTHQRANAQVRIETRPADLEKYQLPDPPNVENLLSIIWGFPVDIVKIDGRLKDVDRIALAEQRLQTIRNNINGTLPKPGAIPDRDPPPKAA